MCNVPEPDDTRDDVVARLAAGSPRARRAAEREKAAIERLVAKAAERGPAELARLLDEYVRGAATAETAAFDEVEAQRREAASGVKEDRPATARTFEAAFESRATARGLVEHLTPFAETCGLADGLYRLLANLQSDGYADLLRDDQTRAFLCALRAKAERARDAPPTEPAPGAADARGDGSAKGDARELSDEERERVLNRLPHAVKKAYGQYVSACEATGERLRDKDAWQWARGHEERPGKRETWERKLRQARSALGEQKHKPRALPSTGRNIVRARDLASDRGSE
jgi:hypothetical protein